jgi:hypothetical protein
VNSLIAALQNGFPVPVYLIGLASLIFENNLVNFTVRLDQDSDLQLSEMLDSDQHKIN